jgi:hypothetical protein
VVVLAAADVGAASTSHTHGNLTNAGAIGTTSGLPVKTGTSGVLEAGAFGTAAGQFAEGNHTHTLSAITDAGTAAAQDADQDLGTTDDVTHRSVTVVGDPIEGQEGSFDKGLFSGNALELGPYTDTGPIDQPPYIEITNLGGGVTKVTGSASPDSTRLVGLPNASGTLALTSDIPISGTKTYAVFTATDNQPPSTAFATLDTRGTGIAVLDFDDTAATAESAVFVGVMPEAASLGSGLIVSLRWMATTATSGDVRWSVAWEKSNTDLDSDSFDTATAATATTNGTSGIVTVTNITCTTIDSLAAGDLFRLRVQRIGGDGADTMTGDAELIAVEVRSAA